MAKTSPKITREQILNRIYEKCPSLKAFPSTWKVGRYPKKLSREEVIAIAKDLKIILRVSKCLVKKKDEYTLEENIVWGRKNDN